MLPPDGKATPSSPAAGPSTPPGIAKLAQEVATVLPLIEAEKRAAASASVSGSAGTGSNGGPGNNGRAGRFRARYQAFQGTRLFKGFNFVNKYRRSFLFGAFTIYTTYSYTAAALHARKRDRIRDSTYLYWKIYDGSIVEAKSSTTVLNSLLFSGGTGGSDEPARIMTIFDVVRTLNWAMRDDRIKGIVADFSSLSAPAVQAGYSLGLAQIEEIGDAIEELNRVKTERLGATNWRSIAFTDSFDSQSQYTLASHFNEVYMQPTGEVPLTGLGSQLPFFKRLIDWLGIGVQAEAREDYKSIVAQYTREKLSEPQTQNQVELLNSLNDLMLQRIARNRFVEPPKLEFNPFPFGFAPKDSTHESNVDAPVEMQTAVAASPLEQEEAADQVSTPAASAAAVTQAPERQLSTAEASVSEPDVSKVDALVPAEPAPVPQSILDKVRKLTFEGPFSAREATENGLITGMSYRTYIFDSILEPEFGGSEENHMMGFYHYYKVMDRAMARKADEPVLDVGVVYLMGTIGESGDFDAGSVVRGLRQAGEDDEIGCVVLRIDSGGGGVVDSDSIDQAVRDLREKKGKVVISSFSNAAASGGYLAAAHSDAILAHPSTITGSIGVAAVRPSFGTAFTDKLKVTVQTILTGSKANDLTSELTGRDLERYKRHIDETYDDFKNRVVEGRQIHPELINSLAGGRVYTGQMVYDLLVDEVERLRVKAAPLKQQVDTPDSGAADKEKLSTVQMPEEQEMSPYAPPEATVEVEAEATALQIAEELDVPPLGPLGRGLVDGLGGIRDAAALAAEVFMTRSLAEVKHDHPDLTDEQAIEQIVPGLKYEITEDGKAVLPIDVNLKQFPAEKSFWQLYKEATSRGDAMTDPEGTSMVSLAQYMKVMMASWVLSVAAKTVSSELDSLGLADVRRSMGIGARPRGRAHMKAQAPTWQLR